MILVAPSVKPGKGEYRWRNNLPMVRAPQWLEALVLEKAAAKTGSERPEPLPPCPPVADANMEALLQAEFKRVAQAPDGTRNQTLNNAALMLGKYVGAGLLNEEQAIQRLLNCLPCERLTKRRRPGSNAARRSTAA